MRDAGDFWAGKVGFRRGLDVPPRLILRCQRKPDAAQRQEEGRASHAFILSFWRDKNSSLRRSWFGLRGYELGSNGIQGQCRFDEFDAHAVRVEEVDVYAAVEVRLRFVQN